MTAVSDRLTQKVLTPEQAKILRDLLREIEAAKRGENAEPIRD